jgi:hypothetical protein
MYLVHFRFTSVKMYLVPFVLVFVWVYYINTFVGFVKWRAS